MRTVFEYARMVFLIAALSIQLIIPAQGLTLEPEKSSITSCICETNLVGLTATNPSDNLDAVVMAASGEKPWIIPGPKEYNLLPRSVKQVTAFVTPDCFAVPGKYSASVTAKAQSGSATATIGIDVSTCVKMEPEYEMELCRGEVAKSSIRIRNIARDEGRSYVITATSKGAKAAAVTVPPKVYVDVNSEKSIDFSIDATELNVGSYEYVLKAQALYEATDVPTTDVDSTLVKVEVKNCESYEVIVPDSVDVCAGVPTTYKAKLINKGAPASVRLSTDSNYVAIKPESGILHYQETADIELIVDAPIGVHVVKINAKSDLKAVEKEMKVNARECFGVEMQMQAEKVICSEYGAEYDLVLKNRENAAEYAITVSGLDAKISKEKVTLGKLQTETLKFTIPKDAASGTYSATITASSKDARDSISKEISLQKCFDFRLTGPAVELCPCEEAAVDFELINFGIKDDTYVLTSESDFLELKDSQVSIRSKEKAKLSATISSCNLESTKYNAIISAKSKSMPSVEDKLKIDLTVRSKEQCYGIELRPASTNINSPCGIKSQSVMVINKGTKETAVSLSATQGSKVTPDNLLLTPGESKEVFLVVFPSPSRCGTQFNVDMKAESRGISVSKQFKVDMEPEEKATPTPTKPAMPSATISEIKQLEAELNYTNETLMIRSLPGTNVLITPEDEQPIEVQTDDKGELEAQVGAGTFLITLSRAGYKPVTLQVNITGNQTGIGDAGAAGNLGSIPLLLVAFLIIVAALYFVLKRGDREEETDEQESEEETEEESMEEPVKPKRGRKRKKAPL